MLLRASSEAIGEQADLNGTIGEGDGGVPHGNELREFAEAATRGSTELAATRQSLIEAVMASCLELSAHSPPNFRS